MIGGADESKERDGVMACDNLSQINMVFFIFSDLICVFDVT